MIKLIFSTILIFTLSSCAQRIKKAARDVKYSAYEVVGMEKRDLFKNEVENVKEEQQETSEAFKDALTKLKEIYAFDGGKVEKEYNKLKDSYEEAQEQSTELKERISTVQTVAGDLFSEWEKELEAMKSQDLKSKSRQQLKATKSRYKELEDQLKKSEKKMEPVLSKLSDQVVFLKHNLNAKAIAGLRSESGKIQNDIEALIKEAEESSRQAEEFIQTL